MQARFFMVDEPLLDCIATRVLGSSLDSDEDVGLLRLVLSCFLSGRKVDIAGLYRKAYLCPCFEDFTQAIRRGLQEAKRPSFGAPFTVWPHSRRVWS